MKPFIYTKQHKDQQKATQYESQQVVGVMHMGWDTFTAEIRTQQAIEMRSMGVDYDFIAKELGYADRSGAWRAVQRGMKRSTEQTVESMRWSIIRELTRIADSLDSSLVATDVKATSRLLQLVNNKVRLANLK